MISLLPRQDARQPRCIGRGEAVRGTRIDHLTGGVNCAIVRAPLMDSTGLLSSTIPLGQPRRQNAFVAPDPSLHPDA
jgi:hypothetical protein